MKYCSGKHIISVCTTWTSANVSYFLVILVPMFPSLFKIIRNAFSHVSLGLPPFIFIRILVSDTLFVSLFSFILWRSSHKVSCLYSVHSNMDCNLNSFLICSFWVRPFTVTHLKCLKYLISVACTQIFWFLVSDHVLHP